MIKTLPDMKNLVLQDIIMTPSGIIATTFIQFEIVSHFDDEIIIQKYRKLRSIKKDKVAHKGDELLGQVYVKHDTHHITGEPVISIYRYVPDFNEDEDFFCDFYDLGYYDVATKEMQNHEDFKHLAIDSNGELMCRKAWEAAQ